MPETSRRGVLGASLLVTSANALGLIGALAVDVATAAIFGLGAQMDAFFLAASVPQVLVSVLTSVSARVLVPVFQAHAGAEGDDGALDRLASALIVAGLLLLGGLVALGLLGVAGAALISGAESLSLTRQVLAVMLLSLIPVAVIEPLRAVHLTHHRFLIASLTNFVRFGTVLACLFLGARGGGVLALAWGYGAGALAQALFLGVAHYGHGGRFVPGGDRSALRALLRRFAPVLVGELAGQSNILVERFFASLLPVGTLSALGYGRRLLSALHSLFVNSVGVALLPRLSLDALGEDVARMRRRMRRSVVQGIRLVTLPTALMATAVVVLSPSVVGLLFERGAFDRAATALTARFIAIYVPSVVLMSASYVMMTALFALGRTRAVMGLRWSFLAFSLIFNAALLTLRSGAGLAAAYTLSQVAYVVVIYAVLRRHLGGFARELRPHVVRLLPLMAASGAVMWALGRVIGGDLRGFLLYAVRLGAAFSVGGLVYALGVLALGLLRRSDIG